MRTPWDGSFQGAESVLVQAREVWSVGQLGAEGWGSGPGDALLLLQGPAAQ